MKKFIKDFLLYLYRLSKQREREIIIKKFNFSSTVVFSNLSVEGNVTIGDFTYINDYGRIDSGQKSKVTIGKHCAIGRFVHITSKTHSLNRPTTMDDQFNIPHLEADVTIGNCVWIGDYSIILPGVTIGDYAVIGAHSLVKQDVKRFEVVGGVPAKHLKMNTEHEKFEK